MHSNNSPVYYCLQAFKSTWFNSANPNGADNVETMENYYDQCSHGKTFLTDVSQRKCTRAYSEVHAWTYAQCIPRIPM